MTRRLDMCLTLNERKLVVVETANRYQKADRKQRAMILSEFAQFSVRIKQLKSENIKLLANKK